MGISENLKRLREIYGLTQQDLADIAGVTNKSVSAWELGNKEPRMGAVEKIAKRFGLKKSNLIEENGMDNIHISEPDVKNREVPTAAPLYGHIAAGNPSEMIEVEEYIDIPQVLLDRHPRAFLLRVNGDSMDKIVPNGALALIDPDSEINSGDVAAIAVNGHEATLKRIHKLNNSIVLEPDSHNPHHKAKLYRCDEGNTLNIIGKMVWYMSKMDLKF